MNFIYVLSVEEENNVHIIIFLEKYDTGLPIPISPISIPNRYRYPPYRTDTDTGFIPIFFIQIQIPGIGTWYLYLVSVPGIGIIPGIGRTLMTRDNIVCLTNSVFHISIFVNKLKIISLSRCC